MGVLRYLRGLEPVAWMAMGATIGTLGIVVLLLTSATARETARQAIEEVQQQLGRAGDLFSPSASPIPLAVVVPPLVTDLEPGLTITTPLPASPSLGTSPTVPPLSVPESMNEEPGEEPGEVVPSPSSLTPASPPTTRPFPSATQTPRPLPPIRTPESAATVPPQPRPTRDPVRSVWRLARAAQATAVAVQGQATREAELAAPGEIATATTTPLRPTPPISTTPPSPRPSMTPQPTHTPHNTARPTATPRITGRPPTHTPRPHDNRSDERHPDEGRDKKDHGGDHGGPPSSN